jgi:membrane associated rhomboid family serine protease
MFPLHDDNPTQTVPYVTWALITACVLAFFWQQSLGGAVQSAVYAFGMIPAVLLDIKSLPPELDLLPAWMTVLTSMFLHGGWMHLIGNMLYLWIFGNNVEDAMGHGRFLAFYLLCGIIAALSQVAMNTASEVPMVGASGAISGVLGAYILLYPHARVLVLIPIIIIITTARIAAYWVLGFWFVMQLISTTANAGQEGGVAFAAHIGGFVAGMVLIPIFKHRHVPLFAPARRDYQR